MSSLSILEIYTKIWDKDDLLPFQLFPRKGFLSLALESSRTTKKHLVNISP
jgi:hypothetical protein